MKVAQRVEKSKGKSGKGSNDKKPVPQAATLGGSSPATGRKEIIKKFPVSPNLTNYERYYETFDWDQVKDEVDWFAGKKVNAAYNAVDRHMSDGRRNKMALYAVGADNKLSKLTFQDIYEQSNK
ncbi:MAG TPA: hypothetical protein PKC98_13770, partial [Candidatus Melainabacteria bacterium]|nr:hypothetical protein [Candidatus Melainabacteria bacterium]